MIKISQLGAEKLPDGTLLLDPNLSEWTTMPSAVRGRQRNKTCTFWGEGLDFQVGSLGPFWTIFGSYLTLLDHI